MKKRNLFAVILVMTFFLPGLALALSLGPYTGKVIDSQTGKPIEGASIIFYWQKRIPHPAGGSSELIEARLIYSNKNGAYNIPSFYANLGLIAVFESTTVIIYEPGYEAYIKTIDSGKLSYSRPSPDFKKENNIVKLSRVPPNFSHKNHYAKIDSALWAIREDPYYYMQGSGITLIWDKSLESNLKAIPEKVEFLRRVEWEEKRGRSEDGR